MKKILSCTLVALSASLLTSCGEASPRLAVASFRSITFQGENEAGDSLLHHHGFLEYDSVGFSDGSWAVYRLKNAPQNSLLVYFDSQKRRMASVAEASERSPQILFYRYDAQGRLAGLLQAKEEYLETPVKDPTSVAEHLTFRQWMETLDFERPDTSRFICTHISYDEAGYAIQAWTDRDSSLIQAPEGYALTVAVEPCTGFWTSDLDGGYYAFHTQVAPKDDRLKTFTVSRYVDFIPTVEASYTNGSLQHFLCHPNPRYTNDSVAVSYIPQEVDDCHLYTEVCEYGEKLQVAYCKGVLSYQLRTNRQGALIEKRSYTFLPGNEVEVTLERSDPRNRQKKHTSTYRFKADPKDDFQEGMHLNLMTSRWSDYYHSAYESAP